MRKKVLAIVTLVVSLFTLVGCMNNSKTFSGIGVTIELDNSFVKKEIVQAPLYLESTKHIFTGVRESKVELANYGVRSLNQYITAVLDNHGKDATIESYNKEGLKYYYAYYNATVNDQEFGYMLFVMEGEDYFYSFNFATLENNFDKSKAQYMKWIKTITIE